MPMSSVHVPLSVMLPSGLSVPDVIQPVIVTKWRNPVRLSR